MTGLADFRAKFPQYEGVSDNDLADKLYSKYYADKVPRNEFNDRLGIKETKTVAGFAENVVENAANVGSALVGAASAPLETVKTLGKTAVGGAQVFVPGRQQYEHQYFVPFAHSVGNDLGFNRVAPGQGIMGGNVGWSAEQLGDNLYERPLDVAMSASTPVAPVASMPGKVGKAGQIATSALNPLTSLPVKGVTTVAKTVGRASNAAKNVPVIGSAARKVTDTLNPRLAAVRDLPSSEQFRQASNAIYDAAERAGVTFTPRSWQRLHAQVSRKLDSEGFKPSRHPDAARELKLLYDDIASGNVSLRGLEQTRSEISRKARDLRKAGNKTDARQLELFVGEIDKFMNGAKAADVVGGINPQAAVRLFEDARATYKKKMKSELLDEAEFQAELAAGTKYTQAGLEHALRQEYKKLIKDPHNRKLWTKDEFAAIRQVAGRSMDPSKVVRGLGKFGHNNPVSAGGTAAVGGGLGGAIGFSIGGPVGAAIGAAVGTGALTGAGAAGRAASSAITRNRVNRAQSLIRGGGDLPSSRLPGTTPAIAGSAIATRQESLQHAGSIIGEDVLNHVKRAPHTRKLLDKWLKARNSGDGVEDATMTLATAIAEEVGRPELSGRIFEELSGARLRQK